MTNYEMESAEHGTVSHLSDEERARLKRILMAMVDEVVGLRDSSTALESLSAVSRAAYVLAML